MNIRKAKGKSLSELFREFLRQTAAELAAGRPRSRSRSRSRFRSRFRSQCDALRWLLFFAEDLPDVVSRFAKHPLRAVVVERKPPAT